VPKRVPKYLPSVGVFCIILLLYLPQIGNFCSVVLHNILLYYYIVWIRKLSRVVDIIYSVRTHVFVLETFLMVHVLSYYNNIMNSIPSNCTYRVFMHALAGDVQQTGKVGIVLVHGHE
jgi:hypothetical protein